MLRLLRIRNFAIIDELELELGSGFNAITGETGAGKSIILDAIALILGNRANPDVIRTGADEATVEALFDISGEELLIKRTVQLNGKNKIFVNGELVTLSQLALTSESLVELCSQHEHQTLAKPFFQLELLDRYGGLLEKRKSVREIYKALKSAEIKLEELTGGEGGAARTKDFICFQLQEINEFNPEHGEEESLQNERKRLMNTTHLMDNVSVATGCLDGGEDDARILVGRAMSKVAKACEMDPALDPALQALARATAELDDAVNELSVYAQNLEVDPGRLEIVEDRLNRWSMMKKKYGNTTEEILQARDSLAKELDGIENRQKHIEDAKEETTAIRKEFDKAATELSKKRKAIARTLAKTIESELSELSMPNTKFVVEFSDGDHFFPEGMDKVQFLFSPNPGEEPKPISKVASGGELSRIMLAVRRTIADQGGVGVYLFDEIDAGIGGQTASIVGKKLKSVSKFSQIICITHLPQVAAFADSHFHVSKNVTAGRTSSDIVELKKEKRVDEIARMLGGEKVTEKSRALAKDLLKETII